MKKWEYAHGEPPDDDADIDEWLNEMGLRGWELIIWRRNIWIFKRELEDNGQEED